MFGEHASCEEKNIFDITVPFSYKKRLNLINVFGRLKFSYVFHFLSILSLDLNVLKLVEKLRIFFFMETYAQKMFLIHKICLNHFVARPVESHVLKK